MEQEAMKRVIGGVEYLVTTHFEEEGETVLDKVAGLINEEIRKQVVSAI